MDDQLTLAQVVVRLADFFFFLSFLQLRDDRTILSARGDALIYMPLSLTSH
jgi:hypothetical protein